MVVNLKKEASTVGLKPNTNKSYKFDWSSDLIPTCINNLSILKNYSSDGGIKLDVAWWINSARSHFAVLPKICKFIPKHQHIT